MLYLVLVLVLTSLGSLVGALTASSSALAWLSTGMSIVAGVALIGYVIRTRSRHAGHNHVRPTEPVNPTQSDSPPDESAQPVLENLSDATEAEVVVVDEHPHYHRRSCAWLDARPVIAIAVGEARELGFTPCEQCSPDAALLGAEQKKAS